MQNAAPGRIVHVLVDPAKNSGADVAPAIITRVWSVTDDVWTVNYQVFYDHPVNGGHVTSALLYPDEQAARAAAGESTLYGAWAFWPPRV